MIILEVTKTMKKMIALLLALLMAVGMLAGCAKQNDDDTDDTNDKLRIVTTIFPEYDWSKQSLAIRQITLTSRCYWITGLTCTVINLPQMILLKFPIVTCSSMSAVSPKAGSRMR